MIWTPEKFERAKTLYIGGLSASEVAAVILSEFREYVSRNAVIGILHRRKVFKDRPEAKIRRTQSERQRQSVSVAKVVSTPPIVHVAGPIGGIGIMDLGLCSCRWIIGGTGHMAKYCGAHSDGIYCEDHSLLAFVPRTPEQEKRSLRGMLWAAR